MNTRNNLICSDLACQPEIVELVNRRIFHAVTLALQAECEAIPFALFSVHRGWTGLFSAPALPSICRTRVLPDASWLGRHDLPPHLPSQLTLQLQQLISEDVSFQQTCHVIKGEETVAVHAKTPPCFRGGVYPCGPGRSGGMASHPGRPGTGQPESWSCKPGAAFAGRGAGTPHLMRSKAGRFNESRKRPASPLARRPGHRAGARRPESGHRI